VSIQGKFRKVLLCGVLELGALMGAPMRPEEIEELLSSMNQPKLEQTRPEENDTGLELLGIAFPGPGPHEVD
jgi:hypothetical protein